MTKSFDLSLSTREVYTTISCQFPFNLLLSVPFDPPLLGGRGLFIILCSRTLMVVLLCSTLTTAQG